MFVGTLSFPARRTAAGIQQPIALRIATTAAGKSAATSGTTNKKKSLLSKQRPVRDESRHLQVTEVEDLNQQEETTVVALESDATVETTAAADDGWESMDKKRSTSWKNCGTRSGDSSSERNRRAGSPSLDGPML